MIEIGKSIATPKMKRRQGFCNLWMNEYKRKDTTKESQFILTYTLYLETKGCMQNQIPRTVKLKFHYRVGKYIVAYVKT